MKNIFIIAIACLAMTGCQEQEGHYLTDEQEQCFQAVEFDITAPATMTFGDEILTIEYGTGNIHYMGNLITTDKELVNAFENMFNGFTCPHCGKSMYEGEQ